jgi:hypothetical protein
LAKSIATLIFAKKQHMENKKATGKYWLWFTVWFAILVVMLVLPQYRPFFWLALPGTVTYFALGFDLIGDR